MERSISPSWRFGDSLHLTGDIVFKGLWFWTAAQLCGRRFLFLDFGPKAGPCVGQGGTGHAAVTMTFKLPPLHSGPRTMDVPICAHFGNHYGRGKAVLEGLALSIKVPTQR